MPDTEKYNYIKVIFFMIIRKEKNGGINSITYQDKIFLNLLYLFYKKVCNKHPDRKI